MIPVIIPFYKQKAQLDRCLRQLQQQTVGVEIFIRDNSHDNVYFTRAVNEGIRRFLKEDWQYILATIKQTINGGLRTAYRVFYGKDTIFRHFSKLTKESKVCCAFR